MEKVIGRPLTDDDYMFKEDVLRRREERKKRAQKADGTGNSEVFVNE
jgi:hypothetical protein